MIQSKFLICAEKAIRDADGGALSIINILDDIIAESFPVLIHSFAVIQFLVKSSPDDSDKPNIRLKVLNNETVLIDHLLKIDFRGKLKSRSIIQFGGLQIIEPGQAHFVLYNSDDAEMDRYTLNLTLRQPTTLQTL